MRSSEWISQARSMIRRAASAPSSHNTQPWLFRISDTAIDLLADRRRALPINDPSDRELTISCGCALMNLRVACAGQGVSAKIQLLPVLDEPDLMARMLIVPQANAPADEAALADFIEVRRTCRRKFTPREVDAKTLAALIKAAELEGARLEPLASEEARQQAANLVAEGNAALWGNSQWRRELAAWMRPARRGDGLTVPAPAAPLTRLIIRTVNLGRKMGAKDRELAETSPLLAVLSTQGDAAHDWLKAGQALERVLLMASRHGLQASFLNQPIQVPSLRPKLRALTAAGEPQILLRLGYPAEEIQPTPRRVVEEVTVPEKGA